MKIPTLPIINQEFTLFIAARFLFIAGLKMTPVILGWKLYELLGSKLALGILGLSEVIPAILLALPAGVRVDRSNKHQLITLCFWAYLVVMIALLVLTLPQTILYLNNNVVAMLIYFAVFLTGIIRAYSSPAINAFLAQLVTVESLVKAASINSMSWLIAAVIGPFVAGILIGFVNVTWSFILVCVLMLSAIIIFGRITPKAISWNKGKTRTWDGVKEGLKFVYHQKALLGAISLDMFAVLFGGAVALLPVFAKDILHVGPQGFGMLMSATYLGNFLAIAYLTAKPLRQSQGKYLIYSVAGFGLCIIVFALSKSFLLSFMALLVSGLFDGVSVIIRGTVFQLFVPDEMRGRVSSVNSIFVNSSNELGQFESGVTAAYMGTIPAVLFGGTMTLLISIFSWFKIPALKKFEW
ncbi:MAG: MFS transporter [Saprospiraceae bacterium]|nr:MFS transporter [Saprospiraceae bacterium]